MRSIDCVRGDFLELEWKTYKYFTCQHVKGNRILPHSKLPESSIYIFPLHVLLLPWIPGIIKPLIHPASLRLSQSLAFPFFQSSILPIFQVLFLHCSRISFNPVPPFQNIPFLYLEIEKFSQDQGFIFVPEEGILIDENLSIFQDPARESKRGFI